jgi:transcriptional regulator with XRE-family HTH domain
MSENKFGNMVLFYRTNNGMTQAEMADVLGISQGMVSHIELGRHKPRIAIIKKFCYRFDVPLMSLIDGI